MDRYLQYPPNNHQKNDAYSNRPPPMDNFQSSQSSDAYFNRPPPMDNFQSTQSNSTVVITDGPKPAAVVNFGPHSQPLICPYCRCSITSRVENKANTKTHIAALLLCGTCLCCCPYCMNTCQARNHYCPQCNTFLGSYN